MKKRLLGKTDLEIASIVFGGNVFGWTVDEQKSFGIMDDFIARGFNMIDTADSYSRWKPGNQGGESEIIIGNWLEKRGRRQDVLIATKVGSDMGEGKNLRKDYIINEVEASLKRLKTDYIDLYFSHHDDVNLPVEEPLEAYEQLIKDGKVRWIGASNFSPERLKEALVASAKHNLPQYQVLQPEYNLYDRQKFEAGYEKIATEHELGVISYYSLASGFLTGKYRGEDDLNKSERGAGIKKYLDERGNAILAVLDQLAKQHDVDQSAVALAWLLHQPAITAPIASVTSLGQLRSFTVATELEFSNEELEMLNNASQY